MSTKFDEMYFEHGLSSGLSLYSYYRWIPELTLPMAFRMIEVLGIKPEDNILDFGCAKGYLVKAMRLLYRNCYGADISEYAIQKSDVDISPYLCVINNNTDLLTLPFNVDVFDYIISKDVFEHISYDEIQGFITSIKRIGKCLFAVIPLGDGKKYYESSYELDVTHIIRENMDWWGSLFVNSGFKVISKVYKIPGIKDNWKCSNGNGLFILK